MSNNPPMGKKCQDCKTSMEVVKQQLQSAGNYVTYRCGNKKCKLYHRELTVKETTVQS